MEGGAVNLDSEQPDGHLITRRPRETKYHCSPRVFAIYLRSWSYPKHVCLE
jgi:hypothetical protein